MAVGLTFVIDRDTVGKNLGLFRKDLERTITDVVGQAADRLETRIDARIPRRTGELARSFRKIKRGGFALVGTQLNRARFIEFGTRGREGGREVADALEGATRRLPNLMARRIQGIV